MLSRKVRLCCRFAAANSLRVPWAAKRTGPPGTGTIAPVLIPVLRTVYSVVQFRNPGTNPGGRDIAGLQLHVCSITQGRKYVAFLFFATHCRLVRFGRACTHRQRAKAHGLDSTVASA